MIWSKQIKQNFSASSPYLAAFFLILATVIAYLPIWHAGFIWDDDKFLTGNPVIRNANGLYRMWFTTSTPDYFPLTTSMLWAEWRLWGGNPLGFHLMNVFLHAFSAVLFWRVLLRLKIPGALFAAGIFAVHPANVESVAWITERKNTLAMFCYLSALYFWIRSENEQNPWWYFAALATFVLALLSKTAPAPLPVVLLGLAWWRRGRIVWKDVSRIAPFFIVALILGLVTVWFQYHRGISHDVVRTDSLASRLAVAGCAIWFYLYKTLLPINLLFVYPRWEVDPRNWYSYLPMVLLILLLGICWSLRKRWGKGPVFGIAYFVLMLLPVVGFLNIYFMRYSLVADHWGYFAILAPIAGIAAVVRGRILRALLLSALGVLTWNQCKIYANTETLWNATIQQNPKCWLAYSDLGSTYADEGKFNDAVTNFQKALAIKPDNLEGHRNLGLALFKLGRLDEAMTQYRDALALQPDDTESHLNMGNALYQMGRLDNALSQYQSVLQTQPENARAHNNLGNIFFQMGKPAEAITHYQMALQGDPNFAEAENGLATCFYRQGNLNDAAAHYKKATMLQPNYANAHRNFGMVLARQGRFEEAITEDEAALKIRPDDPALQNSLAWLLATAPQAAWRDGERAVKLARQANDLTGGNDPMILHTLAGAFAETGKFDLAIETVQKAITLAHAAGQQSVEDHLTEELKRFQAGLPLH